MAQLDPRATRTAALILGLVVTPCVAVAQPGTLDSTFGEAGRVLLRPGSENARPGGIAVDAAGRIVVAGSVSEGFAASRFAATRINQDGTLDTTFGTGGWTYVHFGTSDSVAEAIVIQPDGRIVLAGTVYHAGFQTDFAVARLNADGTPDSSFGTAGRATVSFGAGDRAHAVGLSPGNRIVVAGLGEGPGGGIIFAVARLTSAGALDPSFSGDGRVTIDFPGSGEFANGLDVGADGVVVVAGGHETGFGGHRDFAVARVTPSGVLDATFSGDGRATINFPGTIFADRDDYANDVRLLSDGRILLVGSSGWQFLAHGHGIARLTTTGALDPTFSGDGRLIDESTGEGGARTVVAQPDGKYLVALEDAEGLTVGRYSTDGQVDLSYGVGGRASVAFDSLVIATPTVVLQTDGRALVAGRAGSDEGFTESWIALARVMPDAGTAAAPDAPRNVDILSVSPNPTRGTAAVRVELASPARARLEVRDLLGRRIVVVWDDVLLAREWNVDLSSATPGAYLVYLTTERSVATRLITLLP